MPAGAARRRSIGQRSANRKHEKKAEAHLAQADEDDETTLLMVIFCALHDIEAKEKGEEMPVEEHIKALKAVNLDEPRA